MKLLDKLSIYYLISIFLLSLYILGIFTFGFEKILLQFLPALLSTTLSGAIFDYFELKRWSKPMTPFITGLIIGLVAQFGVSALILSAIGVSAMAIKFLVKLDGRHIFNPAAGGLFAGIMLFSSSPAWWGGGSYLWVFLIWIPILLYKLKRWAPMAGFLLPLLAINGFGIFTSTSLLFFLSVMLIEPKTSPAKIRSGLLYGLTVALGYFLLSEFSFIDPLIPSLLVGNLTARIMSKYTLI